MSQNRPIHELTEQEIQIIREILGNGDTAEISPIRDGNLIIFRIPKEISK